MPLVPLETGNLRCPCSKKSDLRHEGETLYCKDNACAHSRPRKGFAIYEGVPILVSKDRCDTLCDPNRVETVVKRSGKKALILRKLVGGSTSISESNCKAFADLVLQRDRNARVLIVGSGERGNGTQSVWASEGIEVFGIDVYRSESVSVVCDAHYLPFPDQFFDGVLIQAVLEHVVDPQAVVAEIYRVLGDSGCVYSEVPFMQQVHEGAYDFTRFTLSGHRYLFKRFSALKMGPLDGPGSALAWSLRYWVWSITRSRSLARVAHTLFSPIAALFARIESNRSRYDSFSGSFFLGKKSSNAICHDDLVTLYKGNMKAVYPDNSTRK